MFFLQKEMGKKTREDLPYLSKRSYKTKTRISKCFRCNNYYTYPNNVLYCLSCQAENRRKELERLTAIATFCYGWECQEEKPSSSPSPCLVAAPPSSPSAVCPSETQEKSKTNDSLSGTLH